ncbi:MAG: AMP-binding enzyme, partial [Burkholderiales bacterium]
AVEASWQAPVHDVYGCTEAGIIALRRVAHDETWRAVDGVRVWNENGTAWAQGGHVPRAVPLADQISVHGEQEFSLHGRLSDMVKIAGKRASLQALNAELNKIPGVMDAVYFVPDGNNGRLSAFVVAPGLSAQMIITELRKNIDPVFLPRPLHVVAALPRNASGKLPRENLLALAAALPHSRSR